MRNRWSGHAGWMLGMGLLISVSASGQDFEVRPGQSLISIDDFVAVLEDPDRVLGIHSVVDPAIASRFKSNPAGQELSFGPTRSAYWLRFTLRSAAAESLSLLLEVGFPNLDRIELFVPREDASYERSVLGDTFPFGDRPLRVRNLVFPIELAPNSRTTFFLRASTAGTLTVPLRISSAERYVEHANRSTILLGVFYGLFFGSVLYNLFLFLSIKDPIYFYLVGHTVALGMILASVDGLAFQLWPNAPGWQQWSIFVWLILLTVFTVLFVRRLVTTAALMPRVDRVLRATLWIVPVTCIPAALTSRLSLFRVSIAWVMLAGLFLAVVVVQKAWRGHRPARIYSAAWVLLLLAMGLASASSLGLTRHFLEAVTLIRFSAAAEMLLASVAVASTFSMARRAIETSESKFSKAFQCSPNAMLITSLAEGRLIEFNEGFEKLFDYSRSEALGRTASELGMWPQGARERVFAALERDGRIRGMRAELIGKSGVKVPVRLSSEHILIDGEECLVTTIQDQRAREIASRMRKRLIGDLEAKNVELERFNYTVSHDLKSPLVTILGFLGLLERDLASGDGDGAIRDVGRIRSAAERMRELLDRLLELSRIGRSEEQSEVVQLNSVVELALESLAPRIAEAGIEVDVAPDLGEVHGDPVVLREVFQNLLDNAVRYSKVDSEQHIEIGWSTESGEKVYFVRDQGIGIRPRDQATVFELFRRLSTDSEGTGVGLAVVKRAVEAHGGRIWVESDGLGNGSTFFFTLSLEPFENSSESEGTGNSKSDL